VTTPERQELPVALTTDAGAVMAATLDLLRAGGVGVATARERAWLELCGAATQLGTALARWDMAMEAYKDARRAEEAGS